MSHLSSHLSNLHTAFQGRRVFLTGHTGFKGSWLATWLIKLGARVSGYSLAPHVEQPLFFQLGLEKHLTHYIGDICNREQLQKALDQEQPEMVIHLAAQALVCEGYRDPLGTFTTNSMGTLYLLEALRLVPSCRAALFVTTDKVYDTAYAEHAHVESGPLKGDDPYSSSKACAEQMVHAYVCSNLLPSCACATARAGNVIGGGDQAAHRLIPDLLRALENQTPLCVRHLYAVRPWQHVLEPLIGYLQLLAQLKGGERGAVGAWNFGPSLSQALSVEALLQKAQQLLKEPLEVRWEPSRMPETKILRLDARKAEQYLGWKSRLSVDEALEWTLDWHQKVRQGEDARAQTEQQIEKYMKK